MASKLIRLNNGVLVEVSVSEEDAQPVSGGFAQKVNSSLDNIQPLLLAVCNPVVSAWRTIKQDVDVDKITIELGLSFEGEGNLFVTKSKAGANLTVTLELKLEPDRPKLIISGE